MSNVPFISGLRVRGGYAGQGAARGTDRARQQLFRPAARVTCAALIALAVAGCSRDTQRFDYDSRKAQAAQLEQEEERYSEDGFASWRRSKRGDLRSRRPESRRDTVTRSLPDDAGLGEADNARGRLAPLHNSRPRPPRRETHTVSSGDTLYSIARRYDVSVDELSRINGLSDPGLIRVGDTLSIPQPGYTRQAHVRNRQGQSRRRPRRERADRRSEGRRYADDQLYVDPLMGERDDRQSERAERRRSRQPVSSTRPQRSDRSTRPQRSAPSSPPPAPPQRPDKERQRPKDREERTRVARAESRETPIEARAEPTPQGPSNASCSDLMRNPPARSGANFRRPVSGLIISRFGEKSDGQRNDGINISVPRGTPVKAAENGVVVYAGDELTGLGRLVLVRHADGWVSAYAHNDEVMVTRCDTVERGQTIARAGVTGSVDKPQLHFELRKNARPVDPEAQLAKTS